MFELLFPLMFFSVFAIVITTFIITFARIFKEWNQNNKAPKLKINVKVIDKRESYRRSNHNHDGHIHTSHSTTYYITFEVESGDRMELRVPGHEYGLIIVGDEGKLYFQGTRFLSFERK